MAIGGNVRDEKLQYDINRESRKNITIIIR